MASQVTVRSPGGLESCGASLSTTVMVWLALLLLPQASVAVQVRTIS